MTVIRFRRGNKVDLPELAPSGMPLWCEDTKELYLGTGDGVHLIAASEDNTIGYLTPYSVNYGNKDLNGYADLINKVSDTEVSFKVGGIYPNMGVTFPNGNHYEISSVANISGLNTNALYTFVLLEEDLLPLEDGTYSAFVDAMFIGYSYDGGNLLPVMTSNNSGGWTTSASSIRDGNPTWDAWKATDGTNNSFMSAAYSGWWKIHKNSGTFTTKKIGIRCDTPQYGMRNFTIRDQNNNVLQTVTDAVWVTGSYNYYDLPSAFTGTDIILNVSASYNGYTFLITEVVISEYVSSVGGSITEDVKFPENYDTSIVPAMTSNNSGGWTASAIASVGGMEEFRAFDGNFDNNNRWYTGTNNIGWLKIAKNSGTFNLSRIAITAPEDSAYTSTPKDFTIKDQAENILATFTNQIYAPNETKYFDVVGTNISAVKIDITSTNGGTGLAAKEVRLYTTVSSADGDYYLQLSQKPLKPYFRQNSVWIEKQFLKVGQVQKLSGILGTPITYAFNGYYESNWFQVSAGTTYTVNHNIGDQWFIPHYYTASNADGNNGMYVNLAQIGPNGVYGYSNKFITDGKNKLKFIVGSNGVFWDGNNYSPAYTKLKVQRSY